MITVNLTEEQLNLLYDLVGKKFDEVSQAWLPVEETAEMNRLSYNTMLNLRCARESAKFDERPYHHGFSPTKVDHLKENCLVTDEVLEQQGIK